MADKFLGGGGMVVDSSSVTTQFILRSATDNSEVTGKTAAQITASFWRQGGTPVQIALSDLAAIDSPFAEGGIKEASDTLLKGSYRLDVPDSAFAAGVEWVEINAFASGTFTYKERFDLEYAAADALAAVKEKTDQLTFTTPNVVDASATISLTVADIVSGIHTTPITESYAPDGVTASMGQILYMIWSALAQKSISGVTMTTRALDGGTSVMTFTLNDSSNPTSITRTT